MARAIADFLDQPSLRQVSEYLAESAVVMRNLPRLSAIDDQHLSSERFLFCQCLQYDPLTFRDIKRCHLFRFIGARFYAVLCSHDFTHLLTACSSWLNNANALAKRSC